MSQVYQNIIAQDQGAGNLRRGVSMEILVKKKTSEFNSTGQHFIGGYCGVSLLNCSFAVFPAAILD